MDPVKPLKMFRTIASSIFQRPQGQRNVTGIIAQQKNGALSMVKIHPSKLFLKSRCYSDFAATKVTEMVYATCTTTFRLSSTRVVYRNGIRQQRLSSTSENPFMRRTSNVNEDDIPPITLDNTIRLKNVALGTILLCFCFGIAWYSMNAVGQAGTTSTGSGEKVDPLASLKEEAAAAQKKYDKEQETTADAADMLQKFQKGEYDPDHVPDEEIENESSSKKPWWKIW